MFFGAFDLERAGHNGANLADLFPFRGERIVAPSAWDFREAFKMDRFRRRVAREPSFFAGKDEDRRKPQGDGAKDPLDRLERGAASFARRRIAIERIFADVEIKGREIGVQEGREARDDAFVIEAPIGLADFFVEFGEPMQHQPFELGHPPLPRLILRSPRSGRLEGWV